MAEFLATVWRDEDPYRSFERPDAQVRADLARDITGAELILAAWEETEIVGAVLIAKDRRSAAPILTWLAVAPSSREQAVATALLKAALADLAAQGVPALMSAVSAANLASLRWHLSRGFMLEPRGFMLEPRSHGNRDSHQNLADEIGGSGRCVRQTGSDQSILK